MNPIQQAIHQLVNQEPLDGASAGRVAGQILAGEATDAQIGAFLTALRIRGEEPEHILAFASVMRERAESMEIPASDELVDTCGTGGDHAGTFNISTAAALIAAGAGARVAKHGNRAVTGRCGSADALAALGVNINMPAALAARCLARAGCVFCFAPVFHGAMRHAGPARREIGIRTIFNMLGPLSNPAGARRQLIGVYDRHLTEVFARALARLGSIHVMVVHGEDGLDEITLTGPTWITEGRGAEIRSRMFDPAELGLKTCAASDLAGGSAEENAEIISGILRGGEKAGAPRRTIAELNAAAALVVGGRAGDLAAGLAMARAAVDSGAAARSLDALVEASNEGI